MYVFLYRRLGEARFLLGLKGFSSRKGSFGRGSGRGGRESVFVCWGYMVRVIVV